METRKEDAANLPDSLNQWADLFVDAPCSGLGVLRRRPDARWKKEAQDIDVLADIQKKILSSAAKTLRPGGVLVYSTCTLTREENQSVVKWFLESHGDFALDVIPDISELSLDKETMQSGMIQLLPHIHGTDGLFMARMRRKG